MLYRKLEMFSNCVAKMFHKCQKAVRAQSPCNFGLNQASQPLILVGVECHRLCTLSGFRRGVLGANLSVMDTFSTGTKQKLILLRELMSQHWQQSRLLSLLREHIPCVLKVRPANTIRIWAEQCENVMAYRIRRSQQMFSLYTQLWEEKALREIVACLSGRGRLFLIASSVAALFDWDRERICDAALSRHLLDLDHVYQLQETTLTCMQCGLRVKFDKPLAGVNYCICQGSLPTHGVGGEDDWQPYFEREDVTIWRKKQKQNPGLFSYKVYGRYDDVSARDFLRVQLDTTHRHEWDATAVKLQVLDVEPSSGSEILYWETRWPRFMSNRDYVFTRRTAVNADRTHYIIGCESTEHPQVPPRSGLHRVTQYWSFMVVKPTTSFSQPGIEFCLTYFDDPGSSIPAPVVAWVGIRGMPEFLQHLRLAARQLRVNRGDGPEPTVSVIGDPPLCGVDPDLENLFH